MTVITFSPVWWSDSPVTWSFSERNVLSITHFLLHLSVTEIITLKIYVFGKFACKSSLLANYCDDKQKAINLESKGSWPVYWYRQIRLGKNPGRNTDGLLTQIRKPSHFFLQRWRSNQTNQTWEGNQLNASEWAKGELKTPQVSEGSWTEAWAGRVLFLPLHSRGQGQHLKVYNLWHPCQTTHLLFLPIPLLTAF